MSKNKEKKISVIIPFYGNQYSEIIEAIESIINANYQNIKLIIIDNGSTTKASDYIRREFPGVKLLVSKKNLGVCGGRNLGIDNLDGDEDYVLFFDSDQVVDKEMFNELIKPFEKN
jgi:glycosyltransferase involved in cell wall biosynthesis